LYDSVHQLAEPGPGNNPRLSIGYQNNVEVNLGGKIHLVDDLEQFEKDVSKGTWNSVLKYAEEYVTLSFFFFFEANLVM